MAVKGYIGVNGRNNGHYTQAHAIEAGEPLCKRKNTHVIATETTIATSENVDCKACLKHL